MTRLTFSLFALTLVFVASAAWAEEGRHSAGLQGGQVNLTADVGTVYSNALGVGAFFHFAASDWLEFELGYLNSRHTGSANGFNTSLTQNAFNAAIQYDVDQFDLFVPYLKGGVEYLTHGQDLPGVGSNVSASTNGFGLDFGVGGEFDLSPSFMTGLDFTYHSIFDVTAPAPGGANPKAIQSYFTILVRAGFRFGK